MKIFCEKNDLLDSINIVQRSVSSKSNVQVLEGILLDAGNEFKLTGNDMEIGIECNVEADIMEKGKIVLNSKLFGDIVKRLPNLSVRIETESENTVTIKSGSAVFKINSMNPEGFPEIPEIEEKNSFEIEQKILKDMIRETVFAVGEDEYRPILKGSLIECVKKKLNIVSIDGFRIAIRRQYVENKLLNFGIVAPGKTLNEIARILKPTKDIVTISNSNNQIMFKTKKFKLVSRLLQGEFFDYKNAIPEDFETKVILDPKDLLSSMERAYLITAEDHEKNYPVYLDMNNDKMIITADTSKGSIREEIDVEIEGENIKIAFNPQYFIDALRVIEDEDIVIYFRSVGACTIKPVAGEKFIYMILPLVK